MSQLTHTVSFTLWGSSASPLTSGTLHSSSPALSSDAGSDAGSEVHPDAPGSAGGFASSATLAASHLCAHFNGSEVSPHLDHCAAASLVLLLSALFLGPLLVYIGSFHGGAVDNAPLAPLPDAPRSPLRDANGTANLSVARATNERCIFADALIEMVLFCDAAGHQRRLFRWRNP